MRIEETDIENIKNKTNIVDLISKYVSVSKKGNSHVALCPFHNDTNPSMHISEEKQIFKCFSCGEGGNVFTFVQQIENVSYPKAINIVADFINYDMSKYRKKTNVKVDQEKEKLYNLVKNASEFYNFTLLSDDGELGQQYFDKRKIDKTIIDRFKLGYAPEDSTKILMFLTRKGYTVEEIIEAGIGLISEGTFIDRFKGRVIFPISDLNGNIVAFSGRRITNQDIAKYVNSNETKLFRKNEVLYNYSESRNEIKKQNKVYLVEGFMDVIALYKAGINNSVALMGTALSTNQIKALMRLKAELIVSFDGDEPGQNAAFKFIDFIENKHSAPIRITRPIKNKDLDDILQTHGKKGIEQYLNNTYSIHEFIFYHLLSKTNLNNHSDKTKFINYFINYLNNNIKNKIEINHFIELIVEKTKTDKELILDYVDKNKKNMLKSSVVRKKEVAIKTDRYFQAELQILKQMFTHSEAIVYYKENLGFLHDRVNFKIATYLSSNYENHISFKETKEHLQKTDSQAYERIVEIEENKHLPNLFTEDVFLVVKLQKPLQIQIDALDKRIEEENDEKEKEKLFLERHTKLRELRQLRKKYTFPKEGKNE